jgi:hypothetical protein
LAPPTRQPAWTASPREDALLVLQALKRLLELPGFWDGVEPDKRAAATIVGIGEKRKRLIQRTLRDRPSLP